MVVKLAYVISSHHFEVPALQVHDRKALLKECTRLAEVWRTQ